MTATNEATTEKATEQTTEATAETTVEQTLLDELTAKAGAATLADYGDFLKEIAEHTAGNILDEIERNALIGALADNKAIGANRTLINKALLKVEKDFSANDGNVDAQQFELKPNGVYFTGYTKQGEALPQVRICSALNILASTADDTGCNHGILLSWLDNRNIQHRWAMPSELLAGDGAEIGRVLLSMGLEIKHGSRDKVIQYIQTTTATERLESVDRTGWHKGAFVAPDKVYGSDEFIFQPNAISHAPATVKGDLKQWRDNIAAMAAGNSRLVFAISTAFAGSLLEGANVDSGGFHFFGNSSDGKSTAQFIAGSVWAKPTDFVHTWRATANGLEGIAENHNDGLLILDEIGQANGREIGETLYMLANGQGKARMSKTITTRKPKQWRLMALSSGEYTLVDMLKAEGKRSFAGQEVRLANISSDAGAGMGLFENIHSYPTPAKFADGLKELINDNYGSAGTAWLTAITENPEWREGISRAISELTDKLSDGTSRQAGRVARRFALVAYAGEVATQFGITGWTAGEAKAAAEACFESWLAEFGKGNREHLLICQKVRAFIEGNPARFENLDSDVERTVISRVGFIRDAKHYVLASQLPAVADGYATDLIKSALLDSGWIESKQSKSFKARGSNSKCFEINLVDNDV